MADIKITPIGIFKKYGMYCNHFINLDKVFEIKIYRTKVKKTDSSRFVNCGYALWIDCFYGDECIVSDMIYTIDSEVSFFPINVKDLDDINPHMANIIEYIVPENLQEDDYKDRPVYFNFVMNYFKDLREYSKRIREEIYIVDAGYQDQLYIGRVMVGYQLMFKKRYD